MENQFLFDDNNQLKEFQCPVCSKNFSRKFTLDMHLLIHKGIKPHPCPFCGKCFRQKGTLMRHKALHSASNLFHCSLCNRGFRQKNVFLHHLKHRHHVSTETLDRRKYRTELKDYQSIMDTLPPFVFADSTAIASSEKHLDAMLFESLNSGFCDSSVGESSLQNPGNSSSGGGKLSCTELTNPSSSNCNNNYGLNNDIEKDGIQELKYKCNLCFEIFSGYSEYKEHIEKVHNNVEMLLDSKPIICSTSPHFGNGVSTSDKSPKNSSVQENISNDSSSVSCFENKALSETYSNKVSSTNHVNNDEDVNLCLPCQQSFLTPDELECHIKTHVHSAFRVKLDRLKSSIYENEPFNTNNDHFTTSISGCDVSGMKNLLSVPNECSETIKKDEIPHSSTALPKNSSNNKSTSFVHSTKNQVDIISFQSTQTKNGFSHHHTGDSVSKTGDNKIFTKVQRKTSSPFLWKIKKKLKNICVPNLKSTNVLSFQRKLRICKICNEIFQSKISFEYHKQMHLNPKSFKCGYCKVTFSSKNLLLSHTRSLHMKTFRCASCSRVFNYHTLYSYHIQNCSNHSDLMAKLKGVINVPLVEIKKLLQFDMKGILGIIPVCDQNNSDFEIGIPVISRESLKSASNISFLNSFQINGILK